MSASDLFDRLRALDLPLGDYAVFGSGPLAIRSIIDDPTDLDVLCRDRAWELVASRGTPTQLEDGTEIVVLHGGLLTFGRSWAIGDVDVDSLIDTAEVIDGLPFVRIEHVVAYKRERLTPRDREHLELIGTAGLL